MLKDALESLYGKKDLPLLPQPFLFGVATADHQCEAYDQKYADIRDLWEEGRDPKASRRNATDFWNRYEEDIDLAKKLGCTAFRFSLAWSRIEPAPGQFNSQALDHYHDLIQKIKSSGMKPMMTLHHFTWPTHVELRGGMISPDFPDMYAGYVEKAASLFAQDVPYWITFNEPNLLVGGYLKPWWDADYAAPPGMPEGTSPLEQVDAVGSLIRNLFLSHKRAYDIIKRENPNAFVGANQYFYGLPGWLQQLIDRNASGIRGRDDLLRQRDRLEKKRSMMSGRIARRVLANAFEKDKADVVMAALTLDPERERQVMFSQPYFVAGQRLMVSGKSDAADVKDLENKAIAVIQGTTSENELSTLLPGAQAYVVVDYQSALQSLDQNKAEALLADSPILCGLMAEHPGQYRLIGKKLTDNERYAAAVAQGDGDLLYLVDSVVREFQGSPKWSGWKARYEQLSGQELEEPSEKVRSQDLSVQSLRTRVLQRESSGPISPAPEGTALRRIQDRGYLVAAVRQDLAGFGYLDPNTGQLEGLEIDLARALAFRIFGDASNVKFKTVTSQKRIPALQSSWSFLNDLIKQYSILSTILMTNWWYMGMAGKLDEFLCPEGCSGKMDFVGLDYYWGISTLRLDRIQRLIDVAYRHFDQAPVWPEALYNLLMDLKEMFPDKPLIIFENGCVETADGMDKMTYIKKHVHEVQRAMGSGANVVGYVCWSLTSNREWDCHFYEGSDFGLYHVDLEGDPSLKRERTTAADAYQQIIRDRSA